MIISFKFNLCDSCEILIENQTFYATIQGMSFIKTEKIQQIYYHLDVYGSRHLTGNYIKPHIYIEESKLTNVRVRNHFANITFTSFDISDKIEFKFLDKTFIGEVKEIYSDCIYGFIRHKFYYIIHINGVYIQISESEINKKEYTEYTFKEFCNKYQIDYGN
jgi:hypothetical protein